MQSCIANFNILEIRYNLFETPFGNEFDLTKCSTFRTLKLHIWFVYSVNLAQTFVQTICKPIFLCLVITRKFQRIVCKLKSCQCKTIFAACQLYSNSDFSAVRKKFSNSSRSPSYHFVFFTTVMLWIQVLQVGIFDDFKFAQVYICLLFLPSHESRAINFCNPERWACNNLS